MDENINQIIQNKIAAYEVETNRLLGIIGAVFGSLLGVALWLLIDYIGFIAGISGVVMLLASFKGYELLGGRLDRFGIIFCVVLSFIMIFLSVITGLYIEFIREFGFAEVMQAGLFYTWQFIWSEPEIIGYIIKNLLVGYGLYLLAGFSRIRSALKDEY